MLYGKIALTQSRTKSKHKHFHIQCEVKLNMDTKTDCSLYFFKNQFFCNTYITKKKQKQMKEPCR